MLKTIKGIQVRKDREKRQKKTQGHTEKSMFEKEIQRQGRQRDENRKCKYYS